MVSVQVTGTDDVGGLVGSNGGAVSGSFTTGKVSGDDDVGGLVGANLSDGAVSASYSTVQVTGDDRIGGTADGPSRGGFLGWRIDWNTVFSDPDTADDTLGLTRCGRATTRGCRSPPSRGRRSH